MTRQQRLELTWIGKDERPRLEPRILLEDSTRGHQAAVLREGALSNNILIHGDNLLALKAIETEYAGKIKCVYIDPPFNTQQAFANYDDGLEHSIWLSMVRDRVDVIRNLMSDDATLFVHIDDNELAYLTVLLDDLFGRKNRVSIITFKQASATGHKSINPGVVSTSNFILMYAKSKQSWRPNRIYSARSERDKRYGQFVENIDEPCSRWRFTTLTRAFARSKNSDEKSIKKLLADEYEGSLSAFVIENAAAVIQLARPDYDNVSAAARVAIDASKSNSSVVTRFERVGYSDLFLIAGQRILFYKDKLKLVDGKYVAGEPLTTLWDDILSNNIHNEGGIDFPKGKKPEALIKRCIELSTQPGDLVLDSFAGSGTTGAVAHKMGRRWIMVELGDHAITHIIPRMVKIIDGQDPGGVTEATAWKGGGGFHLLHLAPSLLRKDRYGQWVISPEYRPEMLAEAVCKLLGFTYAPSRDAATYWQHGHSTESDFIFVTTQAVTFEALAKLSEEVGEGSTLLVACRAYAAKADAFPNLTIKKIPHAVLTRCEWGRDDYSLDLPDVFRPEVSVRAENDADEIRPVSMTSGRGRSRPKKEDTPSLFGEDA